MQIPLKRICNKCKIEKSLNDFFNHKQGKYGKRSQCKSCENKVSVAYAKSHPEMKALLDQISKLRRIERKSGRAYLDLLQIQDFKCAICKEPEKSISTKTGKPFSLSWDHHHSSNRYRGLLCGNCNRLLGLAHENLEILENAKEYLETWNKKLNL